MSNKFDYKQFEEYIKKVENATKEFDNWLKTFLLQQAQRCISRTKQRQNALGLIDTGFMINSWYIGNVNQVGNTLEIEVGNPAEYASYVEYGHSTRNGGWVEGGFMLTISIDEIEQAMPSRFENEFIKFLKEWGVN